MERITQFIQKIFPNLRILPSWQAIMPIVVIAGAIVIFSVFVLFKPKTTLLPASEKSYHVHVEKVFSGEYTPNLILHGRVESHETATLRAAVSGDILKKYVREGQNIEKGMLLIAIDDRDAKLFLAQHQANTKQFQAQIESEKNRNIRDKSVLKQAYDLEKVAKKKL